MIKIVGLLLAAVFTLLSLLHLYWAAGGGFGSAVAVPSVGGKPTFHPSPFGTVLVAVALLAAALVVVGRLGWLGGSAPRWVFRWATLGIALIFFLRAIGEFKLIGFFKQVSDTPFAYWDTHLFSPLCLLISVAAFALFYNQPQPTP